MITNRHERVRRGRSAFTLIELLVVVAIIALLIAILLPSLQHARDQAKTSVCASNLHQLALAVQYYAGEHGERLPYIRGTPQGPGKPNRAPFYQYDQLFDFWSYLKDLKIYICPNARNENSVKAYPEFDPTNDRFSYYTVLKSDSRFREAYKQGWWPEINPNDNPGNPRVEALYTEYWFNDWTWGATVNGKPIPAISGGVVSKIPAPEYTVIICDGVWETYQQRHQGSNQFAFLDGHVDRFRRVNYLDPTGTRNGNVPKDFDAFGNRPFYAWGLTKEGFDGAGN
jgi:prepilin-type N-terminal cleavage/methylation domain-containing protein/prepilin-type processing-associated H-X9-DG protein